MQKHRQIKLSLLTLLLVLASSCFMPLNSTRAAAISDTQSFNFPISLAFYVPCANGGAGEVVYLSGNLHELFHLTVNNNTYTLKTQFNPQGVSGYGTTTGAKYQGTGVSSNRFNFNAGEELTYINNFRIIGQGPGNNFLVHENTHITVNANGELTAFVDNYSVECK